MPLRGVAVGAGALAVLAARPLGAATGGAAVDGIVAALVALLRLGAVALVGRLAGIAAMGARRVDVLVLVVVALRHCLPPIQVPFPARPRPGIMDQSRTMRTGGLPPAAPNPT